MNLNAVVFAALLCAIFVLGITWGYVLVLAFSNNLRKPPPAPDPTEFVRCGDIAVTFDGTPMVCTRLRGHEMPHRDAGEGSTWAPIPADWRP